MSSRLGKFIDDLPIRRKLIGVILLVVSTALAVTCAALFWFQATIFEESFVGELKSLALVLAKNAAIAMKRGDETAATELLSALSFKKQIYCVTLLDGNGRIFAHYGADALTAHKVAHEAVSSDVIFRNGEVALAVDVNMGAGPPGKLLIRARYQDDFKRLHSVYFAVMVVVIAASFGVILTFTSMLQRVIAGPIVALAQVAREIASRRDYSTRAQHVSRDEVGVLTATFNEMLDQIESRDGQLRQANISLGWEIQDRKEREEREHQLADRALQRHAILLKLSRLEMGNWQLQMNTILAEAARFLAVERAAFWRLHHKEHKLRCEHLFSQIPAESPRSEVVVDFHQHKELFELLSRREELIVSSEAQKDPRWGTFTDFYLKPERIFALLGTAVTRDGKALGILSFEHLQQPRVWTPEEGEFARSIAQQVALYLESMERRRAEESLRLSEQRYRSVVNSVKEVIFQTNAAGEWTFLNPAWHEITGFAMEDCLGHSYLEFVTPDDRPKCEALIKPLLDQKASDAQGEIRFNTASAKPCWIEILAHSSAAGANPRIGISGTLSDITTRKQAEAELTALNQEMARTQRQAGMAEVATGVLHNVGNVLNSVNVSALLLRDNLQKSKLPNLLKATDLLQEHAKDAVQFLSEDPKGKLLPGYLAKLGQHLATEHRTWRDELDELGKNIEHIKEIVGMQQSYARLSGVVEALDLRELAEDAIRMNESALGRHGIQLVRQYDPVPPVAVDKHKVLQILVNLIRNAKFALDEGGQPTKTLTISIGVAAGAAARIEVRDNGVGIKPENLTRIFQHGFTTRKDGHGFGLHSGANAAKEMGGKLYATSAGPGFGAAFTLELPLKQESEEAQLFEQATPAHEPI